MSEATPEAVAVVRVRDRVLNLYTAITILMVIVIGLLVLYSIRLGPLVGPGVEQSFGFALAIMFLAAALVIHVIDRAYRAWPAGRSYPPAFPGIITDRGIANALKVVVLVAAAGAVAYIMATVIAG